jgi:hypothetical protein
MKGPEETPANAVQIFEAKPNRMFTEEQRATVRFLRYANAVPCAECGRKSKTHWTLLISFKAKTMAAIIPKDSGKVHMPLTPVCRSHLLAPAWENR